MVHARRMFCSYHGWVEEVQEGVAHSRVVVHSRVVAPDWDIALGSCCFDIRHNTAVVVVAAAADCNAH